MPTSLRSRSPAEGGAVLIAAQSGRSLAAAARRAGYRPLVADMFGDSDTRCLAETYRQVPGLFGNSLARKALLAALEDLAGSVDGAVSGIVLGSGFERNPDLMRAIARRFPLIGARPETVARIKNPVDFASALERLEIPHPAIRTAPTDENGIWLEKRSGGSGGGHIRPGITGRLRPGRYLQRRVAGEPLSIAFLADGHESQVVAVTRQWTSPSPHAPWRYGGAIEAGAPGDILPGMAAAIARVTAEFGLRGLASADFLANGREWWLLEINPRPGATLDCLDRRPTPLFLRHWEASLGHLGAEEKPPDQATGTMIVYAHRRISWVPDVPWPSHVMDRPSPGTAIPAGAPICTVSACGADAEAVKTTLEVRGRGVVQLLQDGNRSRDWILGASERQRAGQAVD
ncbi:hypothetical protein LMIY3S_02108 [Labrys miyagiensis]